MYAWTATHQHCWTAWVKVRQSTASPLRLSIDSMKLLRFVIRGPNESPECSNRWCARSSWLELELELAIIWCNFATIISRLPSYSDITCYYSYLKLSSIFTAEWWWKYTRTVQYKFYGVGVVYWIFLTFSFLRVTITVQHIEHTAVWCRTFEIFGSSATYTPGTDYVVLYRYRYI